MKTHFGKLGIGSVIGAVVSVAFALPALAGTKDDVRDLQARMERAEQALSAQSTATLRISELENQIQQLTGRIEELNYALDQQNNRLEAISAALAGDALGADQFGDPAFGDGFSAPARTGGPVDLTTGDPIADVLADQPATAVAAPRVELPLNPDAAFDYASGFLLSGDYARAKAAFQLYTEAFPNHTRTADAKFRLGEIHLALGENADAADVFLDHIKSYPNDGRASEAYLKLGTAFARLEKPTEACTVFSTMKSKYPNAPAPVMQRANLEMARIDCN